MRFWQLSGTMAGRPRCYEGHSTLPCAGLSHTLVEQRMCADSALRARSRSDRQTLARSVCRMTETCYASVTAAGSGVAQIVIDGVRLSGLLVCFEVSAQSKGLVKCDVAYSIPRADDEAYGGEMLRICGRGNVQLLISGSDPDLLRLARRAGATGGST